MWFWALLGEGSALIMTFVPSPTFQTIPSEIIEKEWYKAFQIMDLDGGFLDPISLIQSRIGVGDMYFWVMTSIHRLWVEMSLHPSFVARAFAKKGVFLIPHPPNAFGYAIWSHFIHGRTFWSFFPNHRKFEHILLDLFKIDLGIHANAIQ